MLALNQVRKKYGAKLALQLDKLEIEDGLHWIKGANGSGKSTLMKIISGMIPFEGDVSCNGISLKKNPVAYKQLISYAEAEPLYPEFLSGLDLMRFYESVRKSERKDSETLIQRFGIESYFKYPIGTYSSGMTKKLSLVLAFTGSTHFILLDEPFVTLDAATQKILIDMINEFQARGKNFLFTSHQSSEIDHLTVTSQYLIENQTVCRPS